MDLKRLLFSWQFIAIVCIGLVMFNPFYQFPSEENLGGNERIAVFALIAVVIAALTVILSRPKTAVDQEMEYAPIEDPSLMAQRIRTDGTVRAGKQTFPDENVNADIQLNYFEKKRVGFAVFRRHDDNYCCFFDPRKGVKFPLLTTPCPVQEIMRLQGRRNMIEASRDCIPYREPSSLELLADKYDLEVSEVLNLNKQKEE